MEEFKQKVMLVTGGGSGIGRATCRRLAEAGASVIVSDIDTVKGKDAARELSASGWSARFVQHDVGEAASWQGVLDDIDRHEGQLHGLVNNAGLVRFGPIARTDVADLALLMRVMLDGVFLGTTLGARRMMLTGGGVIVNVGSRHALWGAPNESAYAAVKAAARIFTRSVAKEFARANVRINSVLPGPTATGIVDNMPAESRSSMGSLDTLVAHMEKAVPAGRLATADEIARCICFLLSGSASFVVGNDFVVDGGISA